MTQRLFSLKPDPKVTRMGLPAKIIVALVFGALALIITDISLSRSAHPARWSLLNLPPTQIDLSNRVLTERPAGWLDWRSDAQKLRLAWCKRPGDDVTCAKAAPENNSAYLRYPGFMAEFIAHRRRAIAEMQKPRLETRILDGARFEDSFAAGISFRGSTLQNARFHGAVLENAVIREARGVKDGISLTGASFREAQLQLALLNVGASDRTDFTDADLTAATVRFDDLTNGRFYGARLDFAKLRGRINAVFDQSQIAYPSFARADLSRAQFFKSYLDTGLSNTAFRGTDLFGFEDLPDGTGFHLPALSEKRHVTFEGSALQYVDFSGVLHANDDPFTGFAPYWRAALQNSFGDASVKLPNGVDTPCQWVTERRLGPIEFFATWRAWLDKGGHAWPPLDRFENYTLSELGDDGNYVEVDVTDVDIELGRKNIPENCNWK